MTPDQEDGPLVESAARDLTEQFGVRAAEVARAQADAADAIGDPLSGETWRDIANAIEQLQKP